MIKPNALQAKVEHQIDNGPRRAAFKLYGETLNIRHITKTYKTDIARLFGDASYSLAWFRNTDSSITVLVSGDRCCIDYVQAFLATPRDMFASGSIVYSGSGKGLFVKAVAKLLKDYNPSSAGKTFGGSLLND